MSIAIIAPRRNLSILDISRPVHFLLSAHNNLAIVYFLAAAAGCSSRQLWKYLPVTFSYSRSKDRNTEVCAPLLGVFRMEHFTGFQININVLQ